MNRKMSTHIIRKLTALLVAAMLICGNGSLLAFADSTIVSADLKAPIKTVQPAPTETGEPDPTETVEPPPTEASEPDPTETTTPNPTETVEPDPTETAGPNPTEAVEPDPTETTGPNPTEAVEPDLTETAGPNPTEAAGPNPTEAVEPDPTETTSPNPTDTCRPDPTETVEPDSTETVEPIPTETVEPDPTETVEPEPTATVVPNSTETVEPTPEVTDEPLVFTVSVYVQNASSASDSTWVGSLPLCDSNGVPAMSVAQLTELLAENGYALNLNTIVFQYGAGDEMEPSNLLGSETLGDQPVIAFQHAPADTELFVLLAPVAQADDEDASEEEQKDANMQEEQPESPDMQEQADIPPYTVAIEVVNPQEVYYYGDSFTLKAVVTGDISEPVYQWEVLPYGDTEWRTVEGVQEDTYTFVLDETNSMYDIRVSVYEPAAESEGVDVQ